MDYTEEILNDTEEDIEEAEDLKETYELEEKDKKEAGVEGATFTETKAEKFLRLAPPRVDKILKGISSLEKLSAHGSYEYNDKQVTKMFTAIKEKLNECEASFKPKAENETKGFSF